MVKNWRMKRVTSRYNRPIPGRTPDRIKNMNNRRYNPGKACLTARQRSARMAITRMRVSKKHHSAGAVACCMLLSIGFFSAICERRFESFSAVQLIA
jgi:hypothetical protein